MPLIIIVIACIIVLGIGIVTLPPWIFVPAAVLGLLAACLYKRIEW